MFNMYMYFNMNFDLQKSIITINYQLGGSMRIFSMIDCETLADSQQFCKLAISNDSNTSIHNFNLQSI